MDKEIIEEINVEWDMESYPLPCMIIKTAPKDDEVNAWMITTHGSYECRGSNNGELLSY
jgi:hypothetical protein